MKTYIPYSLILAAASCGLAFGAETAYTTPVGYVSVGNTAGAAVPANTDFYVSIPGLDRPAEYAGLVDSVSGSDINLQGTPALPAFTGGVPYIAKITSGAKSGLVALITANDVDTVTVSLQAGESLAGVVSGDKIQIQKAWTPQSLFAGNVVPEGTQILAFSGASTGTNLANDITYEFSAGAWLDLGTFGSADDAVLYPNEGFILRSLASVPTFVVSGTVPLSNSRAIISNPVTTGQDNILSFNSPVAESIGNSGLGVNTGDQVLVFDDLTTNGVNVAPGLNKASVVVLEFTAGSPGSWLDLGTFADATDTFFLQPGQSFVYRTVVGAAVGDTPWSNQPDFVPSL